MSGKTANATAKTMRGMHAMKSVIDFVEPSGCGLLLEVMMKSGDPGEVKRTWAISEHRIENS
jgi:hypothetical protein